MRNKRHIKIATKAQRHKVFTKVSKGISEMKKTGYLIAIFLLLAGSFSSCIKENNKPDIYKNNDISACSIKDPLQNIDWLKEYCENIDKKSFLSINIDLFKVIDKDEHIFQIHNIFPIDDPVQGPTGYTRDWRDCTGKTIFYVVYPGTPMPPDSQERLNEFLKNIEYVDELFHFLNNIN